MQQFLFLWYPNLLGHNNIEFHGTLETTFPTNDHRKHVIIYFLQSKRFFVGNVFRQARANVLHTEPAFRVPVL